MIKDDSRSETGFLCVEPSTPFLMRLSETCTTNNVPCRVLLSIVCRGRPKSGVINMYVILATYVLAPRHANKTVMISFIVSFTML